MHQEVVTGVVVFRLGIEAQGSGPCCQDDVIAVAAGVADPQIQTVDLRTNNGAVRRCVSAECHSIREVIVDNHKLIAGGQTGCNVAAGKIKVVGVQVQHDRARHVDHVEQTGACPVNFHIERRVVDQVEVPGVERARAVARRHRAAAG